MASGRLLHVTSSRNRVSIAEHGLDWTRMGAARGIAGSESPEQSGCFVCVHESDVEWFIEMNNTGGPVDVWAIDGVEVGELRESPEGYFYVPRLIAPDAVELVRRDVSPVRRQDPSQADGGLFFEL